MQVKTFMQMRPLKDAVSHVDKLLFEGFGEVLEARHQMRRIGSIEVRYMIDELGMPQEAVEEAFYWAEAIRDEDLQPPQPGWARFKSAFRIDLLTTKLVVNEASDLVDSLRKRSQQARTRSKWKTKVVDDVLEYLRLLEKMRTEAGDRLTEIGNAGEALKAVVVRVEIDTQGASAVQAQHVLHRRV